MPIVERSATIEADAGVGAEKQGHHRFQTRHPDVRFHTDRRIWKFFLDSYTGGYVYVYGINATSDQGHAYLFRHQREHIDDYRDRVRRSYFLNYCKTIVDIYISTIYKQEVIRKTEDETVQGFWDDVDRKGTKLDDFFREKIAVAAQVLGTAVVVVDLPKLDEPVETRAEEEAAGVQPYLSLIWPGDLIDFSMDEKGEFRWVIYEELGPDERNPMDLHDSYEARVQYKVWTRDEWIIYDAEGEEKQRGTHPVGKVPVVFVKNEDSSYFENLGKSALDDISFINREVFNVCSLIQEYIYRQCFPFLAWPQDEMSDDGRIKIGTGTFIPYPAGTSPGQYISPPTEPIFAQFRYIDRLRNEIYRHAIVGGGEIDHRKQVQSGISKAFDYHSQNQNIVRKAKNLEKGEIDLTDIAYRWEKGGEPLDLDATKTIIQYARDFNIDSINDLIQNAIQALTLQLGATFETELKTRIADSMLPNLTDSQRKKIREELEQMQTLITKQLEAMVEAGLEQPEPGGKTFDEPGPGEPNTPDPPEPSEAELALAEA